MGRRYLQVYVHEEPEHEIDTENAETEIAIFGGGRWHRSESGSCKGGERVDKTDLEELNERKISSWFV